MYTLTHQIQSKKEYLVHSKESRLLIHFPVKILLKKELQKFGGK